MGKVKTIIAILLLCGVVSAQVVHTFPAQDTNNVFTGTNTFNQGVIAASLTNLTGNYIPFNSASNASPLKTLIFDAPNGYFQIQADAGSGSGVGGVLNLQSTNGPNSIAFASLLVGSSGIQINSAGLTIFTANGLKSVITGPGTVEFGNVGGTKGEISFVGNTSGSQTVQCTDATCSSLSLSSLLLSGITGSTQCLHVSTTGLVTGTGSDCGSGGGISGSGTNNTLTRWTGASSLGDSNFSQSGTTMNLSSTRLSFTGSIGELFCGGCSGSPQMSISTGTGTGTVTVDANILMTKDAGVGTTSTIDIAPGNTAGGSGGHTLTVAVRNGSTVGWISLPNGSFANLPTTAVNGSVIYCTDCNSTCSAGGSTGRVCFHENGAWVR